jgi:hypothetical protein
MHTDINFHAKLTQIQRLLDKAEYPDSATRCMLVIEQALRQVAAQYLERVDDQVKQKVLEGVRKRRQQTIDKLTMGQLVYVFQESGFLDACAQTAGKDLSSLSIINLEKLTQLRNKFIHNAQEATPTEAEFLLLCLKVIVTTFDLSALPEKSVSTPSAAEAELLEPMDTTSLSGIFHNRIVTFLTSLPNMADHAAQQALLTSAGLDPELHQQINVAGPPGQFFQLLIPILNKYGTLNDGRHALQAVLEAAQKLTGQEGRKQCAQLIQELQAVASGTPPSPSQPVQPLPSAKLSPACSDLKSPEDQGNAFVPGYAYDVFVSFAVADDRPRSGAKEGWVTTLIRELKRQLAQNLGTEAFELWSPHQFRGNVSRSAEIQEKQRVSAVFLVILSRSYLNSDWCQDQKLDFLNRVRDTLPEGRVFLLERDRLEPDERPAEFGELQGYQFWIEDRVGRPPRTLGDLTPQRDQELYDQRLGDLCYDLAQELRRLKKTRSS